LFRSLAQWDELLQGSAEAVRAQVADAIAQTGGRSYIVAPGCVMPIPTPERNIRAAVMAARGEV
ncbi:MAG: uroporphyrinogen decarboxylase, partial [Chloroflexales bacterium]|nr:uroporphyrinogen decarboxylase [Chloroflexales bacterium]